MNKYELNHSYFQEKSNQSIYWAGYLAADGYLRKNSKTGIYLSVAELDHKHLVCFKKDINAENPINYQVNKDGFVQYRLNVSSKTNRDFLESEYNLTNKKSLTLIPPNLSNPKEIDCFIKGYIDGDGSIFLAKRKEALQDVLTISIIGTKEFLDFIKNRFENILSKKIAEQKPKRKNNKNTYVLCISNQNARIIFEHFYAIECECLSRKWNDSFKKYCEEFQKNKILVRVNKKLKLYNIIFDFLKNKNLESLLKEVKMHPSQLKRMIKSVDYNMYLKVYQGLDTGISDMETEESE